jgi:hypothetical protein
MAGLAVSLVLGAASSAFAESAWVKAATVEVREDKGAIYPSVVTVGKGTELSVLKRDGHWVQVQTGGKTGWVFDGSISSSKVNGDFNLMPGANAEMGTGIAARGLQPGAETYVSSRGLSKAPLEHLIALRKTIPAAEWTRFVADVHR